MQFRKPELIPLLFIIGATVLLTWLGVWQLQRLQWKEGQLAAIEKAQALPALTTLPKDIDGLEYRNVELKGTFQHNKALHLIGRPHDVQEQGFFIVTPFRLDKDGRIILVNRGFAPTGLETQPAGINTIKGVIRPPRIKRYFSPENNAAKNVWFYEDIPAMGNVSGTNLTPIIVEEVGKYEKGVWPMPSDGQIALRNDHLQYAITWFSIALIGLVMFAIYHRGPKVKAA